MRPWAFTVSVIPPILGGVIAVLENPHVEFNWLYLLLTAVGCMSAHAGANMLSDYYDYKQRVDREGTFGSSGLLVQKMLQPVQILRAAWLALLLAGAIGLYFVLVLPEGRTLLYLMLIGGLLNVFYTAGPIEFKYHALGDIAVFIAFGPAMVLGAYFVQAHHLSWTPVLYSLPVALLVDAILHSNNLRDIQNDLVVNIKTIPILIGEKNAQVMYDALIFGAYALVLVMILSAVMPRVALLCFLSLPMAVKLVKTVHNKNKMASEQFALIDAATAQFHSAFSLLLILSLLLHHFLFNAHA